MFDIYPIIIQWLHGMIKRKKHFANDYFNGFHVFMRWILKAATEYDFMFMWFGFIFVGCDSRCERSLCLSPNISR